MFTMKKIILAGMFLCCSIGLQAQSTSSTNSFNLDETYSIGAKGTISLSSDDADVTIIGSNRSDVHVKVKYKLDISGFSFGDRTKFDMTVREGGGNLVIEEQPRDFSGVTFGSTDEDYTILIEAPHGVILELDGDDENYDISEINGRIEIDADDSEANLTACGGNEFSFSMDDGSITMDEGRGSLRIDVDDGQAEIKNANFDEINLDSDDGDFIIYTGLTDGGTYRFDMDDGDLEFYVTSGGGTFNIRHDNADISADQAFRRTMDDENETVFELDGGTAIVRIDVDDADLELRKSN